MSGNNKLKLAVYWTAACGGCDVAITHIHEKILELIEVADLVFWPCAMDFKYSDVENMADGEIDVCLFNGAILQWLITQLVAQSCRIGPFFPEHFGQQVELHLRGGRHTVLDRLFDDLQRCRRMRFQPLVGVEQLSGVFQSVRGNIL